MKSILDPSHGTRRGGAVASSVEALHLAALARLLMVACFVCCKTAQAVVPPGDGVVDASAGSISSEDIAGLVDSHTLLKQSPSKKPSMGWTFMDQFQDATMPQLDFAPARDSRGTAGGPQQLVRREVGTSGARDGSAAESLPPRLDFELPQQARLTQLSSRADAVRRRATEVPKGASEGIEGGESRIEPPKIEGWITTVGRCIRKDTLESIRLESEDEELARLSRFSESVQACAAGCKRNLVCASFSTISNSTDFPDAVVTCSFFAGLQSGSGEIGRFCFVDQARIEGKEGKETSVPGRKGPQGKAGRPGKDFAGPPQWPYVMAIMLLSCALTACLFGALLREIEDHKRGTGAWVERFAEPESGYLLDPQYIIPEPSAGNQSPAKAKSEEGVGGDGSK
eukprot:CAMPEP_0117476000 /NCGR_PEP_ID=MMETSP0784-20121206/10086_1 /TAXON_ID=39447 /ORGANISM="" /LENGTH=397 /DNA_ID=CAMNT_0005270267 /DNA_START=31 /DNA_END=1225 /DNA_ORIENTATION=-